MPTRAHTSVTPTQAADRLSIRELFDAYAHHADRREAAAQMGLFTSDGVMAVYMSGPGSEATYTLQGREALAPVFDDLNKYSATTHFNGQLSISRLADTSAEGEGYCLAHHVYLDGEVRKIMTASLRYLDKYAKVDGVWYFAKRGLVVDWQEVRESKAE